MALRRRGGSSASKAASGHRILIIVGHPDPDPSRLCRALAARMQRAPRGPVIRSDGSTLRRSNFLCFEQWRSSSTARFPKP